MWLIFGGTGPCLCVTFARAAVRAKFLTGQVGEWPLSALQHARRAPLPPASLTCIYAAGLCTARASASTLTHTLALAATEFPATQPVDQALWKL